MIDLKPGDKVVIKGGTQVMTVRFISPNGARLVSLDYTENGQPRTAIYPAISLRKYDGK